ncbi:nbeal1, putative [Ixodes scapularis]|uniref:Nbeal1, putative n=1 Tax=Ixodes scapularis TaxID=6945 RepID=B7P8P2_IXOSC|nr:nbeal1, putative [Ixodes scapularis]|eukprot:XP_002402526.1 nbeal1, putative [Ixodes scapularis]
MKLIHVFGAIICGAQHNAQVAINHNTVDILFQRLREQECSLEVKMTAVRCIMQGIVTLCACVPEALVEETPRRERSCTPVLRNLDVMIHLLHWLPQLESRGMQLWLVEQLEGTVQGSLRSRLDCTRAGVISALIQVLGRSTSLGGKAVGRLLHFLVTLGSCSMSTAELKALFHLLRPDASGEQFSHCRVACCNMGNDAAVSRRTSGGSGDSATSPGASTTEGGRFGASPTDPGNAAGVSFLRNTTLGSFLSGWDAEKIFSMAPSVPANLRSAFNADPDPSIVVTPVDSHEQVWGTSEGLRGQIGSLCVFSEPLQASQVKIMYTGGPKNYTLFKNEDSVEVADLLAKLVVYYDAKASVDGVCTNLAPTLSQYDGRVTGRYCHTQNVKDIINLIGGYPTLYLLLENSGKPVPKGSPSFETTSPPSSNRPSEEVVDDWIVVPSASSSFSGKSTLVPCSNINLSVDCSLLSSDDVKTIRMAVLALVRFYMLRDVNIQDVNAVVSYVLSQKKEELVKEVVEILLQLLDGSATRDQLVLLLYEPNCAELFYCLLLNREFSSCTKVKVLKLIEVLLKSDKVYEKSKSRLRLSEVGFASLTGLVSANEVTAEVAKELVNLILLTDISQGFQGFLALLNLMKTMDVEVKYYAAQKLLSALNENAASLPTLAQQTGWQECVLSLLIKEPISEASCANRATLPSLDLIDLSSLETEAANADSEKPGSPVLKRGTLHRLSQRALVAQQSIEEILPGSPKAASQLLSHLKEHIFDFEITQLLGSGRSRSNSQCSSQEDLSLAGPDATHRSSPIVVTPAPTRKAPELSPRVSPAQHLFGGSPARSPVENGTAGGGGIEARLIETVVEAAFLLAWRGIDGCSKHSWMERGQVLVCINKLALTNELFSSHLDIKRQLFERLLQACCSNLQESGQANVTHAENASELMKLVFDFVCYENVEDEHRLSEKLLENILMVMDLLLVFGESPVDEGWEEMSKLALGILLVCAGSRKLELCAMATARLHTLVQTRPLASLEESCYLLAGINDVLARAVREGDQEHYSFVIPVVRALLERVGLPLRTWQHLPLLPHTDAGPSFFDHFQKYALTPEWASFVANVVKPAQEQYSSVQLKEQHETMNGFWNQCYEAIMVAMHRRSRGVGECKLRFQSQILSAFQTRLAEEQQRILAVQTNLRNQHLFICRRWKSAKLFLTGPCGPWASSATQPLYWKLSQQENFARMRLKLTLNQSFDSHYQASCLRDNQGISTNQNTSWLPPITAEARAMQQKEDVVAEEDILALQGQLQERVFGVFQTRNKMFGRIVALHPPNLLYTSGTRSPAELLRASGLTQRWVNREISSFEYLMHLNTIAGRTYNDLSQYPVFPWVLADYSSSELDLDDPTIYRDLSRPIGIVNPKYIEEVKAKYDSFVDITGTVEKFHYGTHYSNSAGVLHYLVRLEPFTSLHIELQSGRFDVADRQFHSMEGTWKMLMESPNDVKELIPEFFYLPEFLTNMNGFDLGRLQSSKERVDDVKLPLWASSPEDFIYKHRKALESEYVSSHLHEWIDLIFGYKQKGPAAVEALNVFYYVSYEGAVDLDAIKDPVQREATEGIINNFGQTPCQLLKEPHPKRLSQEGALLRMTKSDTKPPNLFLFLQNLKAYVVEAPLSCPVVHVSVPRSPARSFMQHGLMDTLVTVGTDGSLGVHGWLPYDRTRSYPNYFTFERDPALLNAKSSKRLAGVFQPGAKVHSRLFVLSSDAKFLVSGGHWDNSVRAYSLLRGKQVAQVILHKDVVTSLAMDSCGMYLMSGSRDTTCILWELNQQATSGSFLPNKPFQTLCGHDDEVTCVAVVTELDMALSGSKVALLTVSHLGFICIHGCPNPQALLKGGHALHLYTINGKYLMKREVPRAISDMAVYDDFLVTGDDDGLLVIWELFGLVQRASLPLCAPILTVAHTPTHSHIVCSLEDGKLVVVGVSTSSVRPT